MSPTRPDWQLAYESPSSWLLCPLPPERCEWNYGEDDACQLPQDYEPGHHTMCTFHGEVWLHRAAQEYGEDMGYR